MSGKIEKKKYDHPYSMVYNSVLRDKTLSWQAKGLYAYLASNSDDWKIKKSGLTAMSSNKYSSTNSAFNELVERGFIVEDGYERNNGRFQGVNYIFHELLPNGEKQHSVTLPNGDFPQSVFPHSENQQLINTIINNEQVNNIKESKDSLVESNLFGFEPIKNEPNPIKKAKEKKEVHPCHSMFKNYWLDEYKKGDKFDGVKALKINSIISRIEIYLKANNGEVSPEIVFDFFKVILSNLSGLGPFYQTADLSIIDSKFLTIIEQIKLKENGTEPKQTARNREIAESIAFFHNL